MTNSNNTVLVVEDDAALAEALSDTLKLAGFEVELADDGESALEYLQSASVELVVSDVHMKRMDGHSLLKQLRQRQPDLPIMLMTAYGSIEKAVEAMRDGASDYLVKPFEAEVLVNMVGRYVGQKNTQESDMIGDSAAARDLKTLAQRVARKDVTVMITGSSGTGKEVLARHIHQHSDRAEQPFLAINCAAIPENMLEATLFGYEKGAFTGAYKACPGKFELANGGTLLLDEISEMDMGLQSKLLRVLQEREVERLGGSKLIKLDVRILATSNRNMQSEVKAGRFREDLFYRLNVFPLHVPALRDRREDVQPLAEFLLQRHAQTSAAPLPIFSTTALDKLTAHSWPGNIRELENVVQRALVLCEGNQIESDDLHFESVTSCSDVDEIAELDSIAIAATPIEDDKADTLNTDLKQREWDLIVDALRNEQGSRKATAERLGISQRTLRYKLARMREAGVSIPGELTAPAAPAA